MQHYQIDGAGKTRAWGMHISTLVIALNVVYPGLLLAQTNTSATQSAEEIVVTATRVNRSGFTAPTPTSVVSSTDIQQKAQTNLGDILNEIPSFRASTSTSTSGPTLGAGRISPDMRGLGAVRTLVLFDGQRAVPATTIGTTDLNLIPTLLVDRIDVVTGGASASWGSDAVAGVVNVVLKKRMNGLLGDIMVGESQYRDSKETRFGLAGGADFMGGRGHVVAGLDYDNNKGVGDQFTRPWGRENYGVYSNSVNNGLPQRILVQGLYVGNATTGGLITAVSGGASATLRGLAFGPGGTPFTFPFGTLTSATQTVGSNIAGAFAAPNNLFLQVPTKRYNGLGRVSFDLTDNISAFASMLFANYKSRGYTFPNQTAGATALTIRADNAYLPASVKALMPTGSTISVGRYTADNLGAPITFNENRTNNFAAGLQGNFGDGWSWELNAEVGRNKLTQNSPNFLVSAKFSQAIDAVLNGSNQIVCRSTLTNPADGCVPYNIFGQGSPSAAAESYVRAAEFLQQVTKQQAAAFILRGEPVSTWAGPVSLATGTEYRKERADVDVDAISLASGFVSNNPKPLHGSYSVKEAFAETVVPLQNKTEFARSLDFNAAIRYTDYSTSGNVTTWKAGFVYSPVDQLKLRVTRSLDIRAPNLNELYSFAVPGTSNSLVNPFLGGVNAGFVTVLTSGNPNLKPEKANDLTYGFVYEPSWAPKLSLSADYYDIQVKDAISSIANQTIINQCYIGNSTLCALLVRSPANVISQINQQVINISSFESTGIDFQATYRFRLSDLIAQTPGDLSLNLAANYTINAIVNDGVTGPINRAGELSSNAFSRPKWMSSLSATYKYDRASVGGQLRYIGSGHYDNTYAEGVTGAPAPGGFTINDNTIPSVTYVNLNASYDVLKTRDLSVQLYGVINNAFNRAPPADPVGGGSTNPAFYDVVGRVYKMGLRFMY